MEGIEDTPGTALHAGLSWDWETFDDYLRALTTRPHDIDLLLRCRTRRCECT